MMQELSTLRGVMVTLVLLCGVILTGCRKPADVPTATTPTNGPEPTRSQSREDRELAERLLGAWETPQTKQSLIWGVQTFDPNGTATYAGWVEIEGKKQAISISINWRVEGKRLNERVTRSTVPEFLREGRSWSDEIVELTDKRLVTKDSRGNTETRLRVGK